MTQIYIRLLAAVVALGCGVAALIVAIQLVRGVLG
jgi:hypothetical protein